MSLGRPRLVAANRGGELGDLRQVARDRSRRDQELIAEGRFLLDGIQMALCAVSLKGSDRPRKASGFIAGSDIHDGEGIVVAACRGRSRRVVGHGVDNTHPWNRIVRLSPIVGPRAYASPGERRIHPYPPSHSKKAPSSAIHIISPAVWLSAVGLICMSLKG